MKLLIVTADDLGICEGTNLAIARACREGIVSSASLMANGPAYEHGVDQVVRTFPQISIGVHLCLTSGRSLISPERIPDLVDSQGCFRHGFASLYRLLALQHSSVLPQIELELAAQFLRLKESGISIAHVNGHRHIHMIPAIFDAAVALARKFGSPAMRISSEPLPRRLRFGAGRSLGTFLRNLPKKLLLDRWGTRNRWRLEGLTAPDRTYGILDSGCVNQTVLRQIFNAARKGVTEVITHPGLAGVEISPEIASGDHEFLVSPNRLEELLSLIDHTVRTQLERHDIRLVPFSPYSPEAAPPLVACN